MSKRSIVTLTIITAVSVLVILLLSNIFNKQHNAMTEEDNYVKLEDTEYTKADYNSFGKSKVTVTDNDEVNKAIEELMTDKNFEKCELLSSWHDSNINADSFYILFDDNNLYVFSVNDDGVYFNENDYQYYLEMEKGAANNQ